MTGHRRRSRDDDESQGFFCGGKPTSSAALWMEGGAGRKGGWIHVRDAIKKRLVPRTCRRRAIRPAKCGGACGPRPRILRQLCRRRRCVPGKTEGHDTRRRARRAVSVTLRMISSDSRRPRHPQALVTWQIAKRRRGTHDVKNRAEINRTGKKRYRQKDRARPVTAQRRSTCSVAAALVRGRTPRKQCHRVMPKKVRVWPSSSALRQGKDGGIIVLDKAAMKEGKTKGRHRTSTSSPQERALHRRD